VRPLTGEAIIDVLNFSYTNGAQIVQYIPHGADNQQFELRPAATPCAGRDADADGYNACVDCNDNNASVNPGAEPNCNGSGDQNCNGIADFRECEECEFCLDPSGRE
jgi:hypothetical protein